MSGSPLMVALFSTSNSLPSRPPTSFATSFATLFPSPALPASPLSSLMRQPPPTTNFFPPFHTCPTSLAPPPTVTLSPPLFNRALSFLPSRPLFLHCPPPASPLMFQSPAL
ncbi:hypothetical protein DFH09DRAFT_1323755 [Mycena vulgaris]|nr:hypothetical protein DFH09DRAFT_1323755 [Mycena vulgaris]